jgi:hypothetical protein
MNWKEFKEYVESQGVGDDMKIKRISISYPDNSHPSTEVEVYTDNEGLSIVIQN